VAAALQLGLCRGLGCPAARRKSGASRLEHPGIVPIYGLGRHADGRPFYAMRFVNGDSFKDAIARFHSADAPLISNPARAPLAQSIRASLVPAPPPGSSP
jgi:hypothetical protein